MPLYEYQCEACGHRFEVIQKFSDPPVKACTACGGAVQKLLSSPAIQFKGSGWYITDYARAGKSEGGEKSKGSGDAAKADGASSGEVKSGESKPSTDSKTSDTKAAESKSESKTESKPKPAASTSA